MVVSLTAVAPSPANAEFFIDLYGGAAIHEDEKITVKVDGVEPGSGSHGETDFKNSGVMGARVGYYLKKYYYLGLALDGSYFNVDNKMADVDVYSASLLFMVRVPLVESARLQLYGSAGPGIFNSEYEADLGHSPRFTGADEFSDRSTEVGLDARAGLAVMLHKNFGIFGEYRFTYFEPGYQDRVMGSNITIDTTFATHHILGGVSFRF